MKIYLKVETDLNGTNERITANYIDNFDNLKNSYMSLSDGLYANFKRVYNFDISYGSDNIDIFEYWLDTDIYDMYFPGVNKYLKEATKILRDITLDKLL